MFNNYLQGIEGVGIYPMFSLLVFFFFFIGLLVWMFKADKKHLKKMSELPLENDNNFTENKSSSKMELENSKNKFSTKLILLFFVFLTTSSLTTVCAQTTQEEGIPDSYIQLMLILFFGITLMAFALLFYFGMGDRKEPDIHPFIFVKKMWSKLSGAVPVEREDEILLEDDFDGIRELDNKIPPWFNLLFIITVIIAVIYMLNFYVFKTGKLQYQEYDEEMKQAAIEKAELIKSGALVNENSVTRLIDAASLTAGRDIFKANCIPCHGPEAGGVVGPNLTDDYWIHGGGIKNIFHTITYGVPAKGMISWQTQLNPRQIQEVASFVMSLHGTHPVNSKPPQGEKYVEPEDSTKAK